ncbi:NHL domain-containing protein [Glycomyces dulcitolivorans]|uniref:NHL domain-containing protein n=1 Tax=Glycomyces dulcitolivorans TaxID=2200759 RepID=UPI000DD3F696|nr:Ig-like domain-containing protein [Glycomyces dulcitolivorans]
MSPSHKPNAVRILAAALGAGLVLVPALPASADATCPAPDEYAYFVSAFAGPGAPGFPDDGSTYLEAPTDVAVDAAGNVYIADAVAHTVKVVDAAGQFRTVAGNGTATPSGFGGPAAAAGIGSPAGLSLDDDGNLYISDAANGAVYKVDDQGTIDVFAGTPGSPGTGGDGGPATAAQLDSPRESGFTPDGVFYVADRDGTSVRAIGTDGVISTVFTTRPEPSEPTGLATDGDGNVYFTDVFVNEVRVIDPGGQLSAVAVLIGARGLATDPSGNLFVASAEGDVTRIAADDGVLQRIAGGALGHSGDGGPALDAAMSPAGLAVGLDGEIYAAEPENGVVRVLSPVPCALDQELSVESDTRLVADVIGDDVGYRLTVKGYSHPESGSGGISEDGQLRFDPEPGFAGVVSMNYSVIDAVGQMSYGTVTITVGDTASGGGGGGGGVLPATGPGLTAALWAAVALMGGGAAIVFVARRRRVVR